MYPVVVYQPAAGFEVTAQPREGGTMPWTAASPLGDAPTLPASNLGGHKRHQRHHLMSTRHQEKKKSFFFPSLSWNTAREGRPSEDASIVASRCRSRMRRDPGFPAFICSRARPVSATQRGANAVAGREPRAARCLARWPAHFSTGGVRRVGRVG